MIWGFVQTKALLTTFILKRTYLISNTESMLNCTRLESGGHRPRKFKGK